MKTIVQFIKIKYLVILLCLIYSCSQNTNKRNFFVDMKNSYSFSKEEVDNYGNLTSWGLSNVSEKINNINYYKFTAGFGLEGYLRFSNDSLYLYQNNKEQILFVFSNCGKFSNTFYFHESRLYRKIKCLDKIYNTVLKDTIYTFEMGTPYPNYSSLLNTTFFLSKTKGIVSVYNDSYSSSSHNLEIQLYPVEKILKTAPLKRIIQ